MSTVIVQQKASQRKTLSFISQHETGAPKFYALREGVDCSIRCTCGFKALGFARNHAVAQAQALADHREHLRLMYEHAARCPSDAEVAA